LFSIDLGCGYSQLAKYVNLLTNSLTVGIDLSIHQQENQDVRFIQGDIANLEFPSNFFDRIFSVSVLEHVPIVARTRVFDELFRVLRPGGLAVLTIDWIFGMNDSLLEQLSTSQDLGRIGSNIFGNYDFAALISNYAHVASPIGPIDEAWLPGSPSFDEERILADKDILVRDSLIASDPNRFNIYDVDPYKYTTVGIILRKCGEAKEYVNPRRQVLYRLRHKLNQFLYL
jgi:SAM-dependent methyltransferase